MLKNKNDSFLGDEITRNIKYGDNSWQSFGTVDRESSYTKEPILHLLFEGFNYNKDVGDYKDYVARASTDSISSEKYVAASLQHDLYVLNSNIYTTTSTTSSKNIFNLNDYLKYGIALANPVYDSNSVAKKICLLNVKLNDEGKYVAADKNGVNTDTTVFDILKYFLPEFYTLENTNSLAARNYTSAFQNLILRYARPNSSSDNVEIKGEYNDSREFTTLRVLDTTLIEFLNNLKAIKVKVYTNSSKTKLKFEKTVAEIFLDDFSIYLHTQESIKMPFYNRGVNNAIEGLDDDRNFKTRFIANVITKNAYEFEGSSAVGYLEYLNDLVEESIYANNVGASFYASRRDDPTDSSLATSTELAKEILRDKLANPEEVASTTYEHLYKDKTIAETSLLADYVARVDNIQSSISLYAPDVFSGFSDVNSPKSTWSIHFLGEESTENLFQNEDNSYKLYNSVIIGYGLSDTLIAYRTLAGAIYYFIKNKNVANLQIDVPFSERLVNASMYDNALTNNTLNANYYPTVSAINAVYKVGHGESAKTLDIPEKTAETYYSYNFAEEVKYWLENECFLFKGNVYGDYVEELNFMQNLTPDSDVHFERLRLKKTDIVYNRLQDSKYEVPYVEQTAPLVNNTLDNEEGPTSHGSDALAGLGNLLGNEIDENGNKTRNVFPPFIYDFDKGNQSFAMDENIDSRLKNAAGNAQRINSKDGKGSIVVEDRITSPTIDEIWTFLKYLTESDGSGVNSGVNERLPKFYGVKRDYLEGAITVSPADTEIIKNTVNPSNDIENPKVIDILNWKPTTKEETRLHWSSKSAPELQFGGYHVTKYIEKIYDYSVEPFSRRNDVQDGDLYEYNTENVARKNSVTGYLEKLYNSAILAFDLPEVVDVDKTSAMVNVSLIAADIFNSTEKLTGSNNLLFTKENDDKLITSKKPIHSTVQRKKAFDAIANILKYHKANGVDEDSSLHNHYKKYLDNPKNLKEIERDLETIRQNLQTVVEFVVASFVSLGYADRSQNKGTLHQLHRNAYEFDSTLIVNTNNTKAIASDEKAQKYNYTVPVEALEDSLNNLQDTLTVVDLDKKVVFEDGDYQNRYLRDNYDKSVIDLNSNVLDNSRAHHDTYRPNETLVSEVYLAADGTWRSIHEHICLPIIYDEH